MKQIILTMIICLSAGATAEAQQMPKPSPLGKVEQIIGVTKINLEYSRPSVKGRDVFGDLVPYDKIWRLGANACTKLKTSTEIFFNDTKLPKGEYALLAIPSKNGNWTIVINSDTDLMGTGGYDKSKDVLRVKSKAVDHSFTETLSINFDQIRFSSATISIYWEKLKIDIPFTINTEKFAMERIEKSVAKGKELEKVYNRAAQFYYNVRDFDNAIMYADKSLKVKTTGSALFTKARSLNEKGDNVKALKLAKQALEMIQKTNQKGFVLFIEKNINEWSQ